MTLIFINKSVLIQLYKFYKQQRLLKQRYQAHMHITTPHYIDHRPIQSYYIDLRLPLTSRHKDHSHNDNWHNRQALTTRNANQKQIGKINFSAQNKNRQTYSFMKQRDDQMQSGRSCKIVSNNKLKPSIKPTQTIELKGVRKSENITNSFEKNLQYGQYFMNKFTPKNQNKKTETRKNPRNKLNITISSIGNNKPIYTNPLAVRNSQNSQSSSNNESVRIVNERIKELKISYSFDPIVEPYRDRSTDSYHYGQGYGYGKQIIMDRQSPQIQKQIIQVTKLPEQQFVREPKYFYENITNLNSLYTSNNTQTHLTHSNKMSHLKNSSNKYNEMDNIKQDAQQFQQQSKQLQNTRKYQEQQNSRYSKNLTPQATLSPSLVQEKFNQQRKQKKRMFVFPTPIITSKQLKQAEFSSVQHQNMGQNKQQSRQSLDKKQTQAQKCAKITQLYQPFSMQMSSNRKGNMPNEQIESQISKQDVEKKSSSKKFWQHPQQFEDQDKWDKILRMRQQVYNRFQSQNSEHEHGSISKDKIGTAISTAIKYPFSGTPAVSIHESLEQSQRSYALNQSNSPFKNRKVHRVSSPINQLNKALINPIQNSGSQLYSYSYEPSCEYSYLQNSNLNEQQRIKYGLSNQQSQGKINYESNQNDAKDVESLYNKFKNLAANLNAQQNNLPAQPNLHNKSEQQTFTEQAGNKKSRERPSGVQQMTYSYSFQQNQQGEFRYERQLFSKYLHSRHIEWMPILSKMIDHVHCQIQSRIALSSNDNHLSGSQNNQDVSRFRYRQQSSNQYQRQFRSQQLLITFVKIGDDGESIYQNRILSHYIGIWLLTMGYDDPQLKERVVSNVELMFTDLQNAQPQISQDQNKQENEMVNIRQIAQLMYNNLLYGYLPADLHLRALLEVCRKGMQYLTFLIIKILKLLIKIGKQNGNKSNLISNINNHFIYKQNGQQQISDQQMYKLLQNLIQEEIIKK